MKKKLLIVSCISSAKDPRILRAWTFPKNDIGIAIAGLSSRGPNLLSSKRMPPV